MEMLGMLGLRGLMGMLGLRGMIWGCWADGDVGVDGIEVIKVIDTKGRGKTVKDKGKGKTVKDKGNGKSTKAMKQIPKRPPKKSTKSNVINLPPPVSPQTAFQSLTVRRSPRFSPPQNASQSASQNASTLPDQAVFRRKVPKTTALRKGVYAISVNVMTSNSAVDGNGSKNVRIDDEVELGGSNERRKIAKRKVDFGDDDDDIEEAGSGGIRGHEYVSDNESEDVNSIPKVKDNWKADKWHDFIDNDDDDDYYQKLYKNGEMYDNKEFGKLELRTWMIFIDKQHFKGVLKDYCIQEGFAIIVLNADNTRYTCTCSADICNWRLHASKLADGVTWAIKKIEPNKHQCKGLETYNPICNVKWAASKLMEDIRANHDIPSKSLNELLFQRYGVYMKQSSLYTMKNYVIDQLFGGHDVSYGKIPQYVKVICETNPESVAHYSFVQTESIPRKLLFTRVFISFAAMLKGFLGGCRPLIGIDGTHLKGNYGGILLSAVALDGNNEIYPLAYAVVSVEDKDTWSYFLWNLYNIVKESSRKDWTIISDRQKGIDMALADVWPTAKRRYCCRHLSRNYKKQFAGPLMYILFWRVCNATSQFTFRKAMERLKKEGGDRVMTWFAQLGDPSTWSKHKFDPNVCNDSNTSNFVESFNSTLGIDRCRPILTLLEGIRRVCMVRMATRHQAALNWKEDGLCPTYDNLPVLMPPTMKRGVGRPSRNRRREEGDDQKSKRSKTVKCTKCDCFGHNARTCKGGLTEKEKKEMKASGVPLVIKHPRVRNQSNAAKAAKIAATKSVGEEGGSQASIHITQPPDSQSQQQI